MLDEGYIQLGPSCYQITALVCLLTIVLFYIHCYNKQTSKVHGAESFLKSYQVLSSSRILRILWNPNVHHHLRKRLPPVLILSKIESVRTPIPLLLIFILILSPISSWVFEVVSFLQIFPLKACMHLYSPLIPATCPAHTSLLHFITRIMIGEEFRA
jgi:hypothetical protein